MSVRGKQWKLGLAAGLLVLAVVISIVTMMSIGSSASSEVEAHAKRIAEEVRKGEEPPPPQTLPPPGGRRPRSGE